ncbi:MAG: fibronectin type III domain-containing protein [Bacteroidales bacterium]|nr:fibronectin type III domain-containing protein [Bacteroidales bacterium]
MKTKSLLLLLMLAFGLPWVARAQKTLPYEYGFENLDYFTEGWTALSSTFMTGISADGHSGEYGFMFYNSSDPQYLISPELSTTTNGLIVEFYYQNSASSYPKSFRVGYSTNGNGVSDFIFGDEITTTNGQWTFFSQTFDANTKYIAIKYEYNASSTSLFLDDFNFEEYAAYPKPKNLVVTTYTSSTATLDWGARTGQDHWDLYYTTSSIVPDVNTTPSVANTATKPYTITGLASGVTYHAYVRGNYNNGEHYSDWSNACDFGVGCYTPTVVEAQASCDQAYFAWIPVGVETSWQVAFSEQQGFDPDDVTLETVTTQYYIKGNLSTGVTYYARVRAVCGVGDYSDWSDEVSMTTACFAPANLHESSVSPTTATLKWQQGSTESQWQISYSTTANFAPENGTIITVNANPYTLGGLTLNTPYYAYVRAVCGETIYSDWSDICAFMPKYELTVSDDETNYNMYVPFYGSFVSCVTKSQFIIPTSVLTDLLYANIDKLTFYAGVETANFGSATFDILISELDGVTVFENSEFFDWSTMTSVYSGSLLVSDNKMEITLNTPYQYMGGDLLIGFNQTNSGTDVTAYWYGAATTGYTAYGGMEMPAYSYSDYSRYQFIPKTTFSYTPGTAPTCLKPKNLVVSNVGATSATLSWTNGATETAWVAEYATDANFTQNVASVNVATNPYTLTGLTPETTYYARVKADCGGDDYSAWSNACSFMPSAIHTVIINDGTTTNTNVPFRSSIASTTNVKSQFIITSDVLENVAGNHITGLTFYTSDYYPTASYPGAVFKVYLSPTDMTEFSNTTPVDWNTLTEVYSGNLSISDNIMVVSLSAPYLYTSGNLLLAFDEPTLCSSSDYLSWYGVSTNNYPALSYSGSYYQRQFLPKMTITYNTAIATCSVPTNLSINATSNTATLTWTAGDEETNWNVQYKAASASDWSDVIAVEDTPTCTINGLSATTEYQVRIQANCGSSVSSWVTESFTTSCGSVSIPYSYDFSDVTIGTNGAYPQCWTRINDSENSDYNYYPFVMANNKVLKFQASANANAPTNQIAVMPEIVENINALRMSFNAYLSTGNSNKPLSIGVMTDPNDASTFTKVTDVVVRGTSSSVLYPISLEGYQGNGHYIAFKCDKLTSGSDYSIFIDNITVETVPTVAPVNIPYSCNFDAATTGYNAFPPDGWHFSNTYYPYVYENASLAHSGSNFLLMQKPSYESACYAALPAISTTENPINTLKLSFQARMWNSTYYTMYLSIGVMTDPSDISTFQLISSVSVRNDYSLHEIYFDDYAGEGQYIALRCYNTDNYFCIDDIELSVAPTCRQPLDLSTQYTHAHEAEIRWQTRDLRQCNYQVSYSTDETFNPENGTIVDVEFENTLVNAGTDYRYYYLTCLNSNTTYNYYVRANCGNGDFSEWSNDYASLTTSEACPAPYMFYANAVKNTYAELRWYGDIDSEWDFQYKKTSDTDWITPTGMELLNGGEGNELIFRLSGLESGTEYECRVREHCGMYSCPSVDDGYSDWATESFTTGTGCAQPQTWMCLTHMGTSAKLEWYQTGEETRWQIRYRLSTEYEYPAENIVLTDEMPEARKQNWTVTGLQTNSMYYWQVRAYCDSEHQSGWSDESYFFTGGEKVTVDKTHPFYEDFEGDDMPDGWMRCNQYNYNLDYYYPWSFTLAEGPSWDERPGNHGIYNNSDDYHGSTSVLTPEIHIDGNAYSAKLSFWDYCDYGPSAISGQNISYGSMQVMVSSDHGENFDYAWWSFGPKRYWHQFFVDLDEYIGSDIIIRFDYWWANNNPNFDWYIDDVKVQVFDNAFGSGSGVTSGDWNDPSMWGNGTPDGDDDVFINANVTIPDGVVAEANNIVINTDTVQTDGRAQKFGKLTIANGGQLVTNNAVEVTAQKNITPWTTNPTGGWHFIASPVNSNTLKPKEVNHMLTDETSAPYSYDLYRLDGTQWENYHAHNTNEQPFYLQNGQGYLYANANETTLEFTGEIKTYDAGSNTVEVTEGWNLIGNPYPFEVYPNTSYYVMNDTRTGLDSQTKSSGIAVPPCTGIIVKADANGTVAFSKEAPAGQTGSGSLQITLSQANTRSAESIDNAIISFNEGDELPKFYFGESNANIYLPQDGEEYAIVSAEAQGEQPLNFKAQENGEYTLTVSAPPTSNLSPLTFKYLHLIDNITGNDIDLLETPSYTFEAHRSDYASRFKVVFATGDMGHGDDFAFISDGNIIINGTGTVQVIDMMGRVLICSDASNASAISTTGMSSGVYILRLIDGVNVRSQKIVVD